MSRTVELGRAVLALPDVNLQLWLTTLITILPQSAATNIQQLRRSLLIDFLCSVDSWVCRGNECCINLDLTAQGEQFPGEEMDMLAMDLINAPVCAIQTQTGVID